MSEVLGWPSCTAGLGVSLSHREEEELWCPVTPIMSHSINSFKSLGCDHLEGYIKSS